MTCIIACKDESRGVVVGADSLSTAGYDSVLREDPKLFRSGEFVIGFTTSYRMGQALMFSEAIASMEPSGWGDTLRGAVTEFVPAAIEAMRKAEWLQTKEGRNMGGEFIVAYGDSMFVVEGEMEVQIPSERFSAIGSGGTVAHGAMKALEFCATAPVEAQIRTALHCAARFNCGVRAPFTCLSTKGAGVRAEEAAV